MSKAPEPTTSLPPAGRQIARAAGTVMISFVFSNVIGLVAKILMNQTFGTSWALDAYYASNRFSETLFNLVAGGALASAFVPTFTSFLTHQKRQDAWKLASAIANLLLLVLTVVVSLSAIFAPWVVKHLLAPELEDPQKIDLIVALLRVQLPSVVIFSLSGLLMGILNAHQSFLFPALAPSVYSLGLIFGVLFLAPSLGIFGLAWGVVLGALLHLCIQLPALLRLPERRYWLSLGLQLESVREVITLMGPRFLGVAVVQLNFWINTMIAMGQPEGSNSALNTAFYLMLMPQAAIAQSIATAALPTFSAQVARGRLDDMRASLAACLRGVLLLSIPATVGLMVLRRPLVAFLYQRNQFTAESTALVAWALLFYGAGLVGHSVVEIISRAFYALHDTRTPVSVGICAMGLNIGFSFAFSAAFQAAGWPPHGGLALANSLATALEMVALLVLMRRRLQGLEARRIWPLVGQALLATALMGGVLAAWAAVSQGQRDGLITLGGLVLGGGSYLAVIALLRVDEVGQLFGALRRRLPIGRKSA